MKIIACVAAVLSCTSCAAYKVVPDRPLTPVSAVTSLSVSKVNTFPDGKQCFEPMLYVLTLGVVPTHCVNTYRVSSNEFNAGSSGTEVALFKVTSMRGWVALLLPPSAKWKFGEGDNVEAELIASIPRVNQ